MSGLRWAMGGRSAAKLAAVRDELGAPADTPLVITNGDDAASLAARMAQTRLVLTTVGPYPNRTAHLPGSPPEVYSRATLIYFAPTACGAAW